LFMLVVIISFTVRVIVTCLFRNPVKAGNAIGSNVIVRDMKVIVTKCPICHRTVRETIYDTGGVNYCCDGHTAVVMEIISDGEGPGNGIIGCENTKW